jgi:hypothetical protein
MVIERKTWRRSRTSRRFRSFQSACKPSRRENVGFTSENPAFLPSCVSAAQFAGMSTVTKTHATKPARKAAVRKPAPKILAPRQTRAEFVAEIKAIAARIDSGEERTYTSAEVERELGL